MASMLSNKKMKEIEYTNTGQQNSRSNQSNKINTLIRMKKGAIRQYPWSTSRDNDYNNNKNDKNQEASILNIEGPNPIDLQEKARFLNSKDKQKIVKNERERVNVQSQVPVGYKLNKRKLLNEKRTKLADLSFAFAFAGIVFMILENEFIINKFYTKNSMFSFTTKGFISLSTLILVCIILAYNWIMLQIYMNDHNVDNWTISINLKSVLGTLIEVIICLIHPIPVNWQTARTNGYDIDIYLSLPMFLRFYLIGRFILLHSKLFTDASSRSIGAINRIKFNTGFILKTLMTVYPDIVLITLSILLLIVSSWSLRACESIDSNTSSLTILESFWIMAVTMLTIGYGDMYPKTTCGRTVCIMSGFTGVSLTAILIAVLAQKIELKRSEEFVLNFLTETELKKKIKDAAANVLREGWLAYKYKKIDKSINLSKARFHQRKLLGAIQILRKYRLEHKNFLDNANLLSDLNQQQKDVYDIVTQINDTHKNLNAKIFQLENKIDQLQLNLDAWPEQMERIMIMHSQILNKFNNLTAFQPSLPPPPPPIATSEDFSLNEDEL